MRMQAMVMAMLVMVMLVSTVSAGMDSAGTSSLGSYTETDVLTHGGNVLTGGGDLDLETGNLKGVDAINANTVDASSVATTSLDATSVNTSTISNEEGTSVRISDNIEMTGGSITGVTSVQVNKITPTLPTEATSKAYVDKVADDLKVWAKANLSSTTTVTAPPVSMCRHYYCSGSHLMTGGTYAANPCPPAPSCGN